MPKADMRRAGRIPLARTRLLVAAATSLVVYCSAPHASAQTVSAQEVFQQAERAIAENRLSDAATGYQQLVAHSPDLPELHAKLGWIYYQMGSFENGARAFGRALEIKPGMPTAEALLAICQSELGHFRESVPVLERLFGNHPDPSLARMIGLELQRGYLGLKRYREAAATALELTRIYPEDPEILYYTGRLYGDYSFLTMQKLSDLEEDSVWARLAAAEAYETREKYDLAIVEYRKVLGLQPGRAGVHFRIGRILRYDIQPRRPLPEAVAEFEQELEIDPTNASAAYELGEALRVMGDPERAREYFEQAVEHYPDYEEPRIGLARVLLRSEQPGRAIEHLEKAIAVNESNEVPYYLMSQAYRDMGEEEKSREAMQRFQRLRAAK